LACCGDQVSSAGELLGTRAAAIGEQTVVPNAVEALGQDMHEKPADELAGLEGHGLVPVRAPDTVVLVSEGDARRVGGDQAAVGNGDAISAGNVKTMWK
jgi:hypothetical protein